MAAKRKRIRRKTGRKSATRKSRAASVTPEFEAFAIGLATDTLKAQRARARSIAREIFPHGSDIEFLQPLRDRRRAPKRRHDHAARSDHAYDRRGLGARARVGVHAGSALRGAPFPRTGARAQPRHLKKLLAPHERAALPRRAKAFGSDKPLPCAASNVLWSLEQIRAPEAWAMPAEGGAQFGRGIVVGHPDTGYRHALRDLGRGPCEASRRSERWLRLRGRRRGSDGPDGREVPRTRNGHG